MDNSERNREIQRTVENALPIDHFESLITKFLDHQSVQPQTDLVLDQVACPLLLPFPDYSSIVLFWLAMRENLNNSLICLSCLLKAYFRIYCYFLSLCFCCFFIHFRLFGLR